jgi:hypothetical protein
MDTGTWRARTQFSSRLIAIVVGCALLAACDDGPTAPTAHAAPTPVPIPNVAGTWQGRYNPGPGNEFFLCGGEVPATATFTQDGAQISGTVRTQSVRLGQAAFAGNLGGGQLRGTLTIDGTNTRVTGVASADHLTMNWGVLLCGINTLDLRRQP